jgi:L,D-transpeptidase-like protein/putative peptidoglycan binding protein
MRGTIALRACDTMSAFLTLPPSMARGRHLVRRGYGAPSIALAVAGVLLLGSGGAAYAAFRYEQARAHLVMPGVTVAGVDVGGLSRTQAIAAVTREVDRTLGEDISISAGGRTWHVTASEMGEGADVEDAVDRALGADEDMGLWSRFWHRYGRTPLGVDLSVDYSVTGDSAIRAFVDRIAGKVAVAPTDAAITMGADGDLAFLRSKTGRRLRVAQSIQRVQAALEADAAEVRLSTRELRPKVTAKTLGATVVIRVNENRLYLYEGFDVQRTFSVATAKPGWTTPSGVWTIWDKREDPAWYNPALDSWGADLPAVVPGGPGNPMGTRAIYIDAPGLIRIHGTTDDSSIGRYASHGCIRMHNADVEALFDLVPVGSQVIVVGSRPSWAQEWDTPGTADI